MVAAITAGFPWDVHVLVPSLLFRRVPINGLSPEEALELLRHMSLSQVAVRDANIPKAFTGSTRQAQQFLKRLAGLGASDIADCCAHYPLAIHLTRDGRALRLDHENEGRLLFDDSPLGWIINALDGMEPNSLPVEYPFPLTFIRCDMLAFGEERDRVLPRLYTGNDGAKQELDRWRTSFWICDVQAGYARAGMKLQEAWCRQVPNAGMPDPVFRFLSEPSPAAQSEAMLFAYSLWQQDGGPVRRKKRKRGRPASSTKRRRDAAIVAAYKKAREAGSWRNNRELADALQEEYPELGRFSASIVSHAVATARENSATEI